MNCPKPTGAEIWETVIQRRRTTVGRGAFGRPVPVDQHADEVLGRIIRKGRPLTEDAVFLGLYNILRRKNQSRLFRNVRVSKDVGGYRYFNFSPDIDLLEVRRDDTVVGYELKGYRKAGREMKPPMHYEGIDQALAMLKNPTRSPHSGSFAGSVFDYVYLVHPESSAIDELADLLQMCTPLGLIVVNHSGTMEVVKPKPNPFLEPEMKSLFTSRLDTLDAYKEIRVNPVQ